MRDSSISGDGGAAGNSDGDGDGGRRALALAMSRWAGVIRDWEGLTELRRMISAAGGAGTANGVGIDGGVFATRSLARGGTEEAACVPYPDLDFDLDLGAVEAANLRVVSGLIAAGALRRAESRGCHRRRDAAGTAQRAWHTLTRWDGRDLVVTEEEL
jgi:aspartate oxidase